MKQYLIPIFFITALLITNPRCFSQNNDGVKPDNWIGKYTGSTTEGVSKELIGEYENIILKYKTDSKQWWVILEQSITQNDRYRLETIFRQMNEKQQEIQKVAFINQCLPLPEIISTAEQINLWKNASLYGVWINDKRVNNAVLDNLQIQILNG